MSGGRERRSLRFSAAAELQTDDRDQDEELPTRGLRRRSNDNQSPPDQHNSSPNNRRVTRRRTSTESKLSSEIDDDHPPSSHHDDDDDDGDDEDEDDDEELDDLEPEDDNEDDDDDDEEDEDFQPRYSRRTRNLVQRYSPRPTPHKPRSHRLVDFDDYDTDRKEAIIAQPSEAFAQRYSARNRRTVDRFNPLAYNGPTTTTTTNSNKRHRSDYDGRYHRHSIHDDGHTTADDNDEDDDEEERDIPERKTYSFRDRSLVTIKPTQQQHHDHRHDNATTHHHHHHDKLRGGRNFGRRSGRGSGRGHYHYDELPDIPTVGNAILGQNNNNPWSLALGSIGLGLPPIPTNTTTNNNNNNNTQPPQHNTAIAGGAGTGNSSAAANLEITPLEIDSSMTFDQVGGLSHYIHALKEMVFLPLVYPELFERFQVSPPRGVLFYGPPGTGKTLVARALAAHASRAAGGRKVSFFMRKGADVLSKWVGESERHLRLLFEEARRQQPSIIFFDEIDGLAPVRSSRSDQIHNSIVSTLLALMDGLDSRGQVVVIGATNRVDALDGALRRPGRFDRELLFPLPNQTARAEILRIHTSKWSTPPSSDLIDELAGYCVGYCGADIKALTTEASMSAIRRKYPQIYQSEHKLMIDPSHVVVEKQDFITALTSITPASHRAAISPARPLSSIVAPLLLGHLQSAVAQVLRVFPPAAACMRSSNTTNNTKAITAPHASSSSTASKNTASWSLAASLAMQRPRLLICGPQGTGQSYLGSALLYALEGLPVHSIGLPSLLSDASARSPEEGLVHAVAEARRAAPAVLYLPHLQAWWETAPGSLRSTLWALLSDLPPDLPLLLLATANVPLSELDAEASALFGGLGSDGMYSTAMPTHGQRVEFFEPLATALIVPPTSYDGDNDTTNNDNNDNNDVPQLPIAPEALAAEEEAKRQAAATAARKRYEEDQATLRALRMILRTILASLLNNKRYKVFWEPTDPDDDPEYYNVVTSPMDLTTLLDRVDRRRYTTPAQFLADSSLIQKSEREYWGETPTNVGLRNISIACALEDELRAAVESSIPRELNDKLERILSQGGPAPPPDGLFESLGLAADGSLPQPPSRNRHQLKRQQSIGGGSGRYDGDDGDGDGGAGRRVSRLAGDVVDAFILHEDPEAQLRRIRAQKREQQQQQQQDKKGEKEADDIGGDTINDTAADNNNINNNDDDGDIVERPTTAATTTKDRHARVLSSSTRTNVVTGAADDEMNATTITSSSHGKKKSNNTKDTTVAITPAPTTTTATGVVSTVHTTSTSTANERHVTDAEKKEIRSIQEDLAKRTGGLSLDQLEQVYARVGRIAWERRKESDRHAVIHAAVHSLDEAVSYYHQ